MGTHMLMSCIYRKSCAFCIRIWLMPVNECLVELMGQDLLHVFERMGIRTVCAND